jgi:hypothetical protein
MCVCVCVCVLLEREGPQLVCARVNARCSPNMHTHSHTHTHTTPHTHTHKQLRPALAEAVLSRTKLLKWLLARLRVKGPCDSNKQYASEVLSILMQVRAPKAWVCAGAVLVCRCVGVLCVLHLFMLAHATAVATTATPATTHQPPAPAPARCNTHTHTQSHTHTHTHTHTPRPAHGRATRPTRRCWARAASTRCWWCSLASRAGSRRTTWRQSWWRTCLTRCAAAC